MRNSGSELITPRQLTLLDLIPQNVRPKPLADLTPGLRVRRLFAAHEQLTARLAETSRSINAALVELRALETSEMLTSDDKVALVAELEEIRNKVGPTFKAALRRIETKINDHVPDAFSPVLAARKADEDEFPVMLTNMAGVAGAIGAGLCLIPGAQAGAAFAFGVSAGLFASAVIIDYVD